jgi:hypothetical protein
MPINIDVIDNKSAKLSKMTELVKSVRLFSWRDLIIKGKHPNEKTKLETIINIDAPRQCMNLKNHPSKNRLAVMIVITLMALRLFSFDEL